MQRLARAYSRCDVEIQLHSCDCAGLDKNTAQQILKVWENSGAKSPDELRKLLIQRSVRSAGAVLVQTVLDAGDVPTASSSPEPLPMSDHRYRHACCRQARTHRAVNTAFSAETWRLCPGASWGGFSTAAYLSSSGEFPGKIVLQYLAYFLGEPFAPRRPLLMDSPSVYWANFYAE